MKKIIALAIAAAACAPAFAEGFYAGADVGSSHVSEAGVSANATGFNVYGGYAFTDNVALEGGYRKLGNFKIGVPGFGTVKVSGSALQLSTVLSTSSMDGFTVFGRLGINRIEAKSGGVKDSDTKGLFGVGVGYAVSKDVGLRLEVQKVDSDTRVISIGANVKF